MAFRRIYNDQLQLIKQYYDALEAWKVFQSLPEHGMIDAQRRNELLTAYNGGVQAIGFIFCAIMQARLSGRMGP